MEKCHNCGAPAPADEFRDWEALCPHCRNLSWLAPGDLIICTVTKLTDYGILVEVGDGVRALVHISELSPARVEHPSQVVAIGQRIFARVLHVEIAARHIGMSLRSVSED